MGKQEKIVSMFNDIAGTYDVANRVLSMGIDKSWRNKACNLAFICFLYSNFKTSFGQTFAHSSQYVQPLEVKSSLGVKSS